MSFAFLTTLPEEGSLDMTKLFTAYLLLWGVALLVCLAVYILQALSLYTIAKRRCIRKPWLAWLPVGNLWILGSISDQYRYVALGQVRNKRKALLVLEILVAVAGTVAAVLCIVLMVQIVSFGMGAQIGTDLFGTVAGVVVTSLAVSGMKIASTVIQYMADYDYYRSSEPKNAALYLVLSIFFNITRPIFMLLCSKKDEGMPPRKQEPMAAQTQPITEPWERAAEE